MPGHVGRALAMPLLAVCIVGGFCRAEDEAPRHVLRGVLDFRLIAADASVSWLEGGLGKPRYGGDGEQRSTKLRIPQASILLQTRIADVQSVRLHVNLDLEPHHEQQRGRVNVIEAFWGYRPVLSPYVRLKVRAGVFFPPVSLENSGPAWTTPYSITTSAANSWIGEEVRTIGVECGVVFSRLTDQFSVVGALFGANDPAGSLLAWRGWSSHDRQSGMWERLPLAPIPSITPSGLFPLQSPYVEPFREVDGRPGYYAAGSWIHGSRIEINGIYWRNRGDRVSVKDGQYAWKTRFVNAGAKLELPGSMTLLAQHMEGRSEMGPGSLVDIAFYSDYALVSAARGRHRISMRYERFGVSDRDLNISTDDNRERGSSWTAAYILRTGSRHRLATELLWTRSDRPVRPSLGVPAAEAELIFQTAFRLMF
ncbi:MAG: hypothetical protein HYX75_19870 [Acidobacteria bacterium]|nr:hypothetical protein [Acidobacteriota bacterium]